MNEPRVSVLKRLNCRKSLLSLMIVAVLVVTSAAAAITLSEQGSPDESMTNELVILSVSHVPDEAFEDQQVEWTVLVSTQEQGQQGKGLLFTWDWGDGSYDVYHLKSLGANTTATNVETHTWTEPGLYLVVISVWDCYGAEQNKFHNISEEIPFVVKPIVSNTPPMASFDFEPEEGTVDTVFTFDATASSDLEDPPEALEVRWDWESDDEWDTDYSAYKIVEHQFSVPGVYAVRLEVKDSGDLTNWTFWEVTVLSPTVLIPHDPIDIAGDGDFATTAADEGWDGDGSEYDPYVIEQYEINGDGVESAIRIQDTTVFFVIRDCYISEGYSSAVRLFNVVHASVNSNIFTSCSFYSIYCEESESISIQNNTIDGGTHCIGVIRCSDMFVAGNTVHDAEWWPIVIIGSSQVTLRGNAFDGAGIEIGGSLLSDWNTHDIDDTNTVNGSPVYYFKDCDGGAVPSEAGQIILANCTSMTVKSYASGGISLGFSPDNTVTGTVITSTHTGIFLSFSPNNTIESTIVHDCTYGMDIRNSPDCEIRNTTTAGCGNGMWIQQSDRPTVLSNSILDTTWWGIFLYYSSFGEVRYNSIERAALQGLKLVHAESNLIVANNFVDNAVQASEEVGSTDNVWDEGYPSGGNYWSDYQGADNYSGASQTEPGSDGIGDTPYILASGSQDNYPLMEPVGQPQPPPCVPRQPIVIDGDDEFTTENGVVGGSGLPDDPYVISGWEIISTEDSCIDITNTRAYFEIRDVELRTDSFGENAIYLGNVSNGDIINSHTSGSMGGLMMESCSFISVVDCDFVGDLYGVQVTSSTGFDLRNCDFTDCAQAFNAHWSQTFSVVSCTLKADIPCWLDGCWQGVFMANYMESLGEMRHGAYVMGSRSMTFNDNRFVNCSIDITGYWLSDFNTHTISADNTVNGKPILHYQGTTDLVLDDIDAGEIIIVECQDVTVSNMAFSRCFAGVIVAYSNRAVIENNAFTSCWIGTRVYECTEVVLRSNTIDMVVQQGIGIWNTVGAVVEDNVLSSDGVFGYQTLMPVYHSSDVRLSDNTLTDSWEGMRIFSTSNLDVSRNQVSDMITRGVSMGYSSDFQVTDNEFARNGIGLSLERCTGASVHHNNFLDNTIQADDIEGTDNLWDGGYPDGGNYWSDYRGRDRYSGVDQTEPGSDGIGDTPYVLESGSQDNYPFMEPVGEPQPLPYDLRQPIYISGDDDFTRLNGVVSGSGTTADPYVIEGWEIDLTNKNTRAGIYIEHTTAVFVIRNCYVHDGAITNVIMSGISLYDVDHATIISVVIERCGSGLHAYQCDLLYVLDSLFESNVGGISLFDITRSTVWRCQVLNTVTVPTGGLGGLGIGVNDGHNVTILDCTVDGATYTGILASESEEIWVAGNSIRDCGFEAIRIDDNASHCGIYDNDIRDCANGIVLWLTMFWYSPDGGTTIYKCDWYKMDWITICYNYIVNCSDYGIQCYMYTDQETPITNLTIYFNDILDCGIAAVLLNKARYVDIFRNSFQSSGIGVYLHSCLDAIVYSNNFIMNSVQAYDDNGNAWDAGPETGGNYWSDYSGVDEDGDGIGDTPHEVYGGSQDNYPLMTLS